MASELAEAIADAAEKLREESPDVVAALMYRPNGRGLGFKVYASGHTVSDGKTFFDFLEAVSYANKNGLQLMHGKSTEKTHEDWQ
jgi:hypothetical protein